MDYLRRRPWSQREDNILMQLVCAPGPRSWVKISQKLRTRKPKQCRERYHQILKPNLRHDPITAEEGEKIEQLVAEIGNRWAEIARRLNNRSENAVKNWWNGCQNHRRRFERIQSANDTGQQECHRKVGSMSGSTRSPPPPNTLQQEYHSQRGLCPTAGLAQPYSSEPSDIELYGQTASTRRPNILPRKSIELPSLDSLRLSRQLPGGSSPNLRSSNQRPAQTNKHPRKLLFIESNIRKQQRRSAIDNTRDPRMNLSSLLA